MATTKEFADFVVEQLGGGEIYAKKMFGEYGVYSGGKFAAVICDNRLFVKPTGAGRNYIGAPVEAPPYKGASDYFLIEDLENREYMAELLRLTCEELPPPKPKKHGKSKSKDA